MNIVAQKSTGVLWFFLENNEAYALSKWGDFVLLGVMSDRERALQSEVLSKILC